MVEAKGMTPHQTLELMRRAYFSQGNPFPAASAKIGHITIWRKWGSVPPLSMGLSPSDGSWNIKIIYRVDAEGHETGGLTPKISVDAYEQEGDPTDDLIWLKLRV